MINAAIMAVIDRRGSQESFEDFSVEYESYSMKTDSPR